MPRENINKENVALRNDSKNIYELIRDDVGIVYKLCGYHVFKYVPSSIERTSSIEACRYQGKH